MNTKKLVEVLSRARAEIEELIAVNGTDPHDKEDMAADNYQQQWETLQMITAVIREIEEAE